jgi:hypothetical protein
MSGCVEFINAVKSWTAPLKKEASTVGEMARVFSGVIAVAKIHFYAYTGRLDEKITIQWDEIGDIVNKNQSMEEAFEEFGTAVIQSLSAATEDAGCYPIQITMSVLRIGQKKSEPELNFTLRI